MEPFGVVKKFAAGFERARKVYSRSDVKDATGGRIDFLAVA
jgi:hypothetical protein